MGVIDDILAKEPEQRTVEFCTDRHIREALSEAQADLGRARIRADQLRPGDGDRATSVHAEISDLEATVESLTEQARANLIRFTFAALDPEVFDEIKGKHRPTETQLTAARKEKTSAPQWNVDTFPPVLVAAACVKLEGPSGTADGLSIEGAQAIWKSRSYNEAERAELFNTALGATLTRTRVDLPKGG